MQAAPLDPRTVKREQRTTWDGIGPGWEASLETFERGAAAVTGRLLALGGVRRGHRVLDVATGLGEPALAAARMVGPAGRVLGTDISPAMLEIARRRAGELGNVKFAAGDLESLDLEPGLAPGSFDVVLSRWGLMFAVDHAALFRSLAGLLAPGGVLAAAVWGPPQAVPMMSLGYSVLGERLELPPPPAGQPGPFSMSDPGRLARVLAGAGFTGVSVEEFTVPFRFGSTREWVDFTRAVTPRALIRRVGERFGSEDDPATWGAVGTAAERFRSADGGLSLPSTALCLRAVAPSGGAPSGRPSSR
ncbi:MULTISPECIES: class I SAM-dependent methyltransferase [Thermomonosporaceae]|uniref:class I SAM-dependent methyltransferase n=1 Tax=Thermomonosporaceae TaxID=2012 RepID=UPI00255AB922|nr:MULTISPECIES: class I SAM-dependent methyltransferase [Thermomonosporaceae]MDL4776692.1 class I SAM-dependent methyltransferase [Actinomadura xylanilytica]